MTDYTDNLPASHTIRCTYQTSNQKTYCEPTGTSNWTFNSNSYQESCTINSTGYVCIHYKMPAHTNVGTCTYKRDTGGPTTKATHTASCVGV